MSRSLLTLAVFCLLAVAVAAQGPAAAAAPAVAAAAPTTAAAAAAAPIVNAIHVHVNAVTTSGEGAQGLLKVEDQFDADHDNLIRTLNKLEGRITRYEAEERERVASGEIDGPLEVVNVPAAFLNKQIHKDVTEMFKEAGELNANALKAEAAAKEATAKASLAIRSPSVPYQDKKTALSVAKQLAATAERLKSEAVDKVKLAMQMERTAKMEETVKAKNM